MAKPIFVFAHGAGAPSTSDWMKGWTTRLESLGKVHPFDYPYMARGSRSPDPLPKLIAAHRDALAQARGKHPGPVVLVGKSMGSRVGCHVSLEEPVDALVCLGYPLRGINGAVRDEVLVQLGTPILFVQGTRDKLCPLDLLEEVMGRMSAPHRVHRVESGDHSLLVTKRSGLNQNAVDAEVLQVIREFVG